MRGKHEITQQWTQTYTFATKFIQICGSLAIAQQWCSDTIHFLLTAGRTSIDRVNQLPHIAF
jgi:hypothetical protein